MNNTIKVKTDMKELASFFRSMYLLLGFINEDPYAQVNGVYINETEIYKECMEKLIAIGLREPEDGVIDLTRKRLGLK